MIENGQVARFHDDLPFSVMNLEGEIITIEPCYDFGHYYEVWENTHYFGLPHGGGWVDELPWTIEFLKMFNRIHSEIESYRIKKR